MAGVPIASYHHSYKRNKNAIQIGTSRTINFNSQFIVAPSNIGIPVNNSDHTYFKINKERSLFLRNLPFHFRDEHLRQLIVSLADEGENAVELCRVKYSLNQGKTLQVGIVMLRTEEAAKQVLERISASPRCCGRDVRYVIDMMELIFGVVYKT